MKTRIFTVSLMLMAVVLFSCKKDKEESASQQEVSFQANQIIPDGGLKSTNAFDVQCSETEPSNAHIVIGGVAYDPSVYRVDGILYTQSIKLDAGSYNVTEFFLYKDTGPAGYDNLDEIVMATPAEGSTYAVYTTPDLPHPFTVSAFTKTQVPMQVLCFEPNVYDEFGFNWFAIGEVVLREACFFGDICLNGEPFVPADFNGSLYGSNVGVDVPAIMNIIVKRGGVEVPNSPFTNEGALTSPLCVQYPDNLNVDGEVFTFELQLWLPDGIGFSYQTYATYTATDDGAISTNPGADGVFDFVVGTCGYQGDADQTFNFLFVPPTPPLLAGDYLVVSSTDESHNLAGLRYEILDNGDGTITFNLWPTLFVGSPYLQALTVGIVNEAGTFSQDITYGSSDGTPPVDELVLGAGGVYSYTAPAGSLTSGEVGIFLMVNGRAPDNGNDLQRWIGITSMMTTSNDWGGFSWAWANRFKITLP